VTQAPWGDWNAVRYPFGEVARDHVESYFLKATSPEADRALWLKATIFASAREREARAEAWAIAFDQRSTPPRHVAVKRSVPLASSTFSTTALAIEVRDEASGDKLELADGWTEGSISTGERRVAWRLAFGDRHVLAADPLVLLPHLRLYLTPVPSSKTVTPLPDGRFDGELVVDGERWAIDGWAGMQGHNWGRGHAEEYAWCHCNQWQEEGRPVEGVVLEVIRARLRLGGLLTPPLCSAGLRMGSETIYLNGPIEIARARSDMSFRHFSFEARGRGCRLRGEVDAPVDRFVGLYYLNPSGAMTYCLNSKLARARLRVERGTTVSSLTSAAAALEIGTRDPDHGVTMQV
jgi:hypothetical protein